MRLFVIAYLFLNLLINSSTVNYFQNKKLSMGWGIKEKGVWGIF